MDSKVKNTLLIIIGALLVVAGLFYFLWAKDQGPGKLDDFAKCLDSKGLKMYGAFWCPHCQDQKSLFGKSAKYLPYVECSTPDSNGELAVCTDQKIEGYPTWKLPDDSKQEGELSLQELAQKSGCALPK